MIHVWIYIHWLCAQYNTSSVSDHHLVVSAESGYIKHLDEISCDRFHSRRFIATSVHDWRFYAFMAAARREAATMMHLLLQNALAPLEAALDSSYDESFAKPYPESSITFFHSSAGIDNTSLNSPLTTNDVNWNIQSTSSNNPVHAYAELLKMRFMMLVDPVDFF